MKELRFEDLYSQEYYFEKPGFDCRITIKKFIDARDTMGMARFSLSYINQEQTNDWEKNFIKTIHLRHAIEDLNNSFDLLLQIPWMFYRIWQDFNTGGCLRSGNLKNREDIIRNSDGWVLKAEQACDYKKVLEYLHNNNNHLGQKLEDFSNIYIKTDSSNKDFTVRTLCNILKHNHALSFKELYEGYAFNIKNTDGTTVDLRKQGLSFECHQDIYDEGNPSEILGKVKYYYDDDLSIDIEFTSGDRFNYKDISELSYSLDINAVYDECCSYYDALVDLYEEIYREIYPNMQLLPAFITSEGKPNIKHNPTAIDTTNYFKEA